MRHPTPRDMELVGFRAWVELLDEASGAAGAIARRIREMRAQAGKRTSR